MKSRVFEHRPPRNSRNLAWKTSLLDSSHLLTRTTNCVSVAIVEKIGCIVRCDVKEFSLFHNGRLKRHKFDIDGGVITTLSRLANMFHTEYHSTDLYHIPKLVKAEYFGSPTR